ncbi:MAG: hypothetical protein ACRELA_00745 [Candidatus Rokuibacteriota bacterium]
MPEDALAHVDPKVVGELTTDLINIPSPMGGERAVAEYLADRFRATGLRTWLQEVEPERFNVYGVREGTGGGPTLMYCGHLNVDDLTRGVQVFVRAAVDLCMRPRAEVRAGVRGGTVVP